MAKGGRREGAGRPKGSLNKATADVKLAAQSFTTDALETLAGIMRSASEPAAARVSAAKELLDRGHGKATQPIAGDDSFDPLRITGLRVIFDDASPDTDTAGV